LKTLIKATDIHKYYKSRITPDSFTGYIKSVFSPKFETYQAIKNVSLEVSSGECLGFLGPNGAGKSTFIKLLCGIQTPTSGEIEVLGYKPQKREVGFYQKIGVVFGHKTSLWWDLPLLKSLEMAKLIYKMREADYKKNLHILTEALNLNKILSRPVRVLSLGERVKGELAMNLIFEPKLLFLDEPTIGLDIQSKYEIRNLINQFRDDYGMGIFLTSHDMGDIDKCCNRVIMVNQGEIRYTGTIDNIKKAYGKNIIVEFEIKSGAAINVDELNTFLKTSVDNSTVIELNKKLGVARLQIPKGQEANLITETVRKFDVNVHVNQASLEEVMLHQFRELKVKS